MSAKKVWKGRFSKPTAPEMEAFSHSLEIDRRLYREDIQVNRAWAQALAQIGLLKARERDAILKGLDQIEKELEGGKFPFLPTDEDIHTAIERRLTEQVGPAGAKIHTGRSRNDQVITDLLLYLRRATEELITGIRRLQEVTVQRAEEHSEVLMPGYTHLQQAQPILFSHYALSLFWLLERDRQRLMAAQRRCGLMPLGSGALAGSGFPIDRHFLSEVLGFEEPSPNSLDATAHRDVPIEVAFAAALLLIHLSRYAADLILWASHEFGFVTIDEAYATGSSMMPQKRNPDSLELIRGKAAAAIGHLTALMSLCHGLPHGYNRDLQEDKRPLFAILDDARSSLEIFTRVWQTLDIQPEAMIQALDPDLLATELADYLTHRGMPFRKAHEIAGQIIRWSKSHNVPLTEIPLSTLRTFSYLFDEDLRHWLDFRAALERRSLYGGTGPEAVREQLEKAKQLLSQTTPEPESPEL